MHTTSLDIVRDYIVSTTYRKHEQRGANWTAWRAQGAHTLHPPGAAKPIRSLDESFPGAPAYGPERRPRMALKVEGWSLPAAPRNALGRLGDLGASERTPNTMSATERLSAILTYASKPLRWEPLNASALHRGIPSPSSLFLAEIYVVGRDRAGNMALARYLPDNHMLARIDDSGTGADLLADDALTLVIVGQLSRCLSPYGEFSPCLMSLEAGHLQVQLALLCQAVGWDSRSTACPADANVAAALGLAHWTQCPLVRIAISGLQVGSAWPAGTAASATTADLAPQWQDADSFPRLRQLIEAIGQEAGARRGASPGSPRVAPASLPALPWRVASTPIEDLVFRRSAGSFIGMAPLGEKVTQDSLRMMMAVAAHLRHGAADEVGDIDLTTLVSMKGSGDATDGGYSVDLDSGRVEAAPVSAAGRGHEYTRVNHVTRERSLVITLAVDDLREMRRFGPRAFILSHIAAGAAAQRLCLAAAAVGMFARPIKAYADFLVDTALPLERRSIYQLVCCFEQQATLSFDLR